MKLLVFTYAPAGLGHLRVTGALVHSRPKDDPYELLGSSDPLVSRIHRFTSVNPLARKIMEFSQYGIGEDAFTKAYVWVLRKTAGSVYMRMIDIIFQHPGISEITVIATHFGLAHQIGVVKNKISKKTGVKINLVVQVTDDTSQHIWCVKGADMTMVPSILTKKLLSEYAEKQKMAFNCEVSPYPLSPVIAVDLPKREGLRETAFEKGNRDPINVMVPISGAAVGLGFLTRYLRDLDLKCSRFHFLIVAKRSMATRMFLSEVGKLRWVEMITGRNDNEVVRLYEKTYEENLIHLEITKPSEQAFKALIPPTMVGGSILLLTTPVGRQETDNINFLKRHKLLFMAGKSIEDKGAVPRGVDLPDSPEEAARLTMQCLDNGLFEKMAEKEFKYLPESYMSGEVNHRGTWLFWEKLKVMNFV